MLFWASLIAGLVLVLVNPPLFAAAGTVGAILLIVAGIMLLFQLLGLLAFNKARKKMQRDFNRRF